MALFNVRLLLVSAPLLIALQALAASPNAPAKSAPSTVQQTPAATAALAPKYVLKVFVVRTCNDDGTQCSAATQSQVQAGLDATNEVHRRSGSGIKFVIDSRTDFTGHINRTVLNADCLIPTGVVPEQVKKEDVNSDGKVDDADSKLVCDSGPPAAERTAFALKFPHSVVAYARGQARNPKWDAAAGHWTLAIPSGGYSSCNGAFVAVCTDFGGGTFFAHESGHYLCSPHTFGSAPADVPATAKAIKDYVEKNNVNRDDATAVLKLFDPDCGNAKVCDTPPDPGPTLFKAVYGDPCDPAHGIVNVSVTFSDNKVKTYALKPARDNVMSYFKSCPPPAFDQHFTKDQVKQHIATLTGKRRALLESDRNPCGQASGLQDAPANMSTEDLIKQRARIIAGCMRAYRRPKPGEIYMEDIYANPAEVLKQSIREMEHEHPAGL